MQVPPAGFLTCIDFDDGSWRTLCDEKRHRRPATPRRFPPAKPSAGNPGCAPFHRM